MKIHLMRGAIAPRLLLLRTTCDPTAEPCFYLTPLTAMLRKGVRCPSPIGEGRLRVHEQRGEVLSLKYLIFRPP